MNQEHNITLRKMKKTDIAQVSEMMCSSYRWLGKKNGFTQKQVDFLVTKRGSVRRLKSESQQWSYLMALIDDVIVGAAAVNTNELGKLYVDPDYHGQKIGTMLFDWAQQIIANAGYKEMIVGVMAGSAIGFYKKMGMSKYDEKILVSGAFTGCKVPLMKKVLTDD